MALERPLLLRGILFRSSFIILSAFILVGIVTVSYTAWTTSQRTQAAANLRLNELLDTIESTLRVACFAQDTELAREVAEGLLNNTEVLAVLILTGSNILANVRKKNSASENLDALALHRNIHSPFNEKLIVGQILLTPSAAAISARIHEEVSLITAQFIWQLTLVAGIIVATMLLLIARPIKAMSDALHRMNPTAGERLSVPAGHASTEIGRLVADVNQLADHLVSSIEDERGLRLRQEMDEKKYHAIFDNAESGIFIVDRAGRLTSWNRAFSRLFEIPVQLSQVDSRMFNDLSWDNTNQPIVLIETALYKNAAVTSDLLIHLKSEHQRWLSVVLSPIDANVLQGVIHDVTELKEAEVLAKQQAITDPLTGLVNRTGLEATLKALFLQYALDEKSGFALLMVNLDGFRKINEGIGLPAGDEILRTTRTRLSACIKRDDLMARLSGDIFAIVLPDVFQGNAAKNVANRILQALRLPYFVNGSPINLHGSIGITLFPADGDNVPALFRHAELAVNKAKAEGGNTCIFFNPGLAEAAEKHRQLEGDLRGALRNSEFVLFYQPIIDLINHRLAGAEALIRWQHPSRGLIAPDDFIPLAEQNGLINEIGLWALNIACQQLVDWQDAGFDYYLSLNVSGRQIPDGLPPAALQEAVNRYGLDPGKLCLEITEGVLLGDINRSLDWLQAVHNMGFRVYLDDFGTGYSSLSYLKRFPVDTLKVDKSFVQDLSDEQGEGNDRTLVTAIIAMAKSLGLQVVAEGVETLQHARILQAMGCHYAQGYHYSRPVPVENFNTTALRIATMLLDEVRTINH